LKNDKEIIKKFISINKKAEYKLNKINLFFSNFNKALKNKKTKSGIKFMKK